MILVLHSRPWITPSDHQAVSATLESRMIGQGAETAMLEEEFSAWVNAPGSVAVSSGSAALLLALRALRAGPDSDVIMPTYVCQSVLDAVIASGARPLVSDVGQDWVITPDKVVPLLSPRTAAIIVPHMYGIFADVVSFQALGVPVIEDCAQAIGRKEDHASMGDIAVFSFHPTKCLTTGEGGLATSRDVDLLARLRRGRDGSDTVTTSRLFAPLADLLAALGRAQLLRYDEALKRRRQIALRYREALAPFIPTGLNHQAFSRSMHFRFVVRVPGGFSRYGPRFEALGVTVRRGVDSLNHRLLSLPDSQFPVAVRLFDETLSLPIYPAMTDDDVRSSVDAAIAVLGRVPSDHLQ